MKSKLQVVRLSGKAQGVIFILTQVCSEQILLLNVMLHNNVQHIKKLEVKRHMWKETMFYYGITLVG